MTEIEVEIINKSPHPAPRYATEGAAGADLFAWTPSGAVVIPPGGRALVGTGLQLALPPDCEAQLRPRSGLALKHGITLLNSPATIDADYRGELRVLLINHGEEAFEVTDGLRIAQLVLAKVARARFVLREELDETTRGGGGFGHTGFNP